MMAVRVRVGATAWAAGGVPVVVRHGSASAKAKCYSAIRPTRAILEAGESQIWAVVRSIDRAGR
jgi:hypothetical protein